MSEIKKTFSIKGMHCASCVTMLERALKQVDGVSRANVNLATEKAAVFYDSQKVTDQHLASAVSNIGYQAMINEELKSEDEEQKEKKWPSFSEAEEGQLAIDIYQTEQDLVIQSAIAGVKPENLDISMEKDIIRIKGSREKPFEEKGDYFSQECFWGLFSREIILPAEIDPERAMAEMKNGILTIRIPKILREKKRRIVVRG